jgi:HK97 family phage prohead protease
MESIIRVKDYIRDYPEDMRAERRFFTSPVEFAEVETNGSKVKDENIISGYAAVFNKDSESFGWFIERISPGAFTDVLNDDAFALFNHSQNLVLGRNKVNVTLSQDDVGLRYVIKLPDTNTARDIRSLIKAEIITQSSFAFTVKEERFVKGDKDKPNQRIIDKIERLYDVSPVTVPAYKDTTVAARSFKKIEGVDEISSAIRQRRKILSAMNRHSYTRHKLFTF